MFQLEGIETRHNEQAFAIFLFFHAKGSLVVSMDAKDSIVLLFFN